VTLPRTEGRDARLADLDQRPTVEVVRALTDSTAAVVDALRAAEDASLGSSTRSLPCADAWCTPAPDPPGRWPSPTPRSGGRRSRFPTVA
jgi:hypothetical protein